MKHPRFLLVVLVLGSVSVVAACTKGSWPTSPDAGAAPELSSGNIPTSGVFQHTFADTGTQRRHHQADGACALVQRRDDAQRDE